MLVQVLDDGAAELAGDGHACALADPRQPTREQLRHLPAVHAPHLLSMLVTTQTRPDQIPASGASRIPSRWMEASAWAGSETSCCGVLGYTRGMAEAALDGIEEARALFRSADLDLPPIWISRRFQPNWRDGSGNAINGVSPRAPSNAGPI